jgi:hypothetical protein
LEAKLVTRLRIDIEKEEWEVADMVSVTSIIGEGGNLGTKEGMV